MALCKRCLSVDPADRPSDAAVVAREVATLRSAADERARKAELDAAEVTVRAAERAKRRRIVAAVVALGVAGIAAGLVRAESARRAAEIALAGEAAQKQVAEENAARAEAARDGEAKERAAADSNAARFMARSDSVWQTLNFVVYDIFAAAGPVGQDGGLGVNVTLRQAIDVAAKKLTGRFGNDPPAEASLRYMLGISYLNLGQPAEATTMFERCRDLHAATPGLGYPGTRNVMLSLATSYDAAGRAAEALALWERVLALYTSAVGPDHPDTLAVMDSLATSYYHAGRAAEALALWERELGLRTVKLGPDHPDTLRSMNNLASRLRDAKREGHALPLLEDAVRRLKPRALANDQVFGAAAWQLVSCYSALGRGADAIATADDYVRHVAGAKELNPTWVRPMLELCARHLAATGDGPGCRATAEMHEALALADAGSLYDRACYRALAAGCYAKAGDVANAKLDADRAMAHLTEAIAAGYRDAAHMATDDDLAILRTRPDFRRLVERITPELAPPPRVVAP